jgi:hypothetical protein
MKSVADNIRGERVADEAAMTPAARVELALRLGDHDREIFRRAQDMSDEEALRELRRRRQLGRVSCSFLEVEP